MLALSGVLGQKAGGMKLSKTLSMLCIHCDSELFLIILLNVCRNGGIYGFANNTVGARECE